MSVEMRSPPRMPQPEQWMSEHPFCVFVILVGIFVGFTTIGVWL